VERLSKKYQWIALNEFLGLLSDHYHFHDFNRRVRAFKSARQLGLSDLLDPFVSEAPPDDDAITWEFAPQAAPWWFGGLNPLPRPLATARQRELAEERDTFSPTKLIELHDGQREWLTLSAFPIWHEPVPVWHGTHITAHVGVEWAIQSYMVSPDQVARLVEHLNQRDFVQHSSRWLGEPEFGQSLATLRTFPIGHEKLRRRCQIDQNWETEDWRVPAIWTTCRCAPDEERRRARDGSIPSPQLADQGNLRWMGRAFDFERPGELAPTVQHLGQGFRGACVIQRPFFRDLLKKAGLRLVWRVYGFKYRLHEHGENHAREHWGTFVLGANGNLKPSGGATCAFPHGPGPEEPLPWLDRATTSPSSTTSSQASLGSRQRPLQECPDRFARHRGWKVNIQSGSRPLAEITKSLQSAGMGARGTRLISQSL